jgi:nucleoside-diphosphate kinase
MSKAKILSIFCTIVLLTSSTYTIVPSTPPTTKGKTSHKDIERTCAIIKPDAVSARVSGMIIYLIELNKFNILRMHKTQLTKKQAELFYAIHKDKPFFGELVDYMISGPVILMALGKDNAIAEWRTLMGATDPKKAVPGTLRKMFGTSITNNAAHGSDSPENAEKELAFFFPELCQKDRTGLRPLPARDSSLDPIASF